MYSSLQKKAQSSEKWPCPECGEMGLHYVTEDITLSDGKKIHKLRHLKCGFCKSRFFDDEAMHFIQWRRKTSASPVRT